MASVKDGILPDEVVKDVTPEANLIQTVKTIVLSLQLLDEKCFQSLVVDVDYHNIPCMKLVSTVSKF